MRRERLTVGDFHGATHYFNLIIGGDELGSTAENVGAGWGSSGRMLQPTAVL